MNDKRFNDVKIFPDPRALGAAMAESLVQRAQLCVRNGRDCSIALSGGGTPRLVYEMWAAPHVSSRVPWKRIRFFWGDERCVSPDHKDSNYCMTRKALLSRVPVPETNIHRIRGESDPAEEAERYEIELKTHLPAGRDRIPCFDWILLGMGADGHTASLFPDSDLLDETERLCGVATHPETQDHRITLTFPIITHARQISLIVTGSTKAEMVRAVLADKTYAGDLPVQRLAPHEGRIEWNLDSAAASALP